MGLAGMCIPLFLLFAGYRWGLELVAAGLNLYCLLYTSLRLTR